MKRGVLGFHLDDAGDWVADLACFHGMHVRHRPPFELRPWVLTEDGRRSRLGAEVDCVRCDRCELPPGLHVAASAGPFRDAEVPQGLRRRHQIAEGRWGLLHVLEGSVVLTIETEPALTTALRSGGTHALPPGVAHHVGIDGPVTLRVDFLVPSP